MSVYLSPVATILQYFTDVGVVLSGGQLFTYQAGTSTPQATFTDSTGAVQNSNPIVLASNGRLNNVSVWQPGGVALKVVVEDANGNPLGSFDQLQGLNDPAALLTSFANPANGSGVDLVANAMKSYSTMGFLRGAPPPTLLSGQTLVVDLQGSTVPGDSGGGLFYWNATSTATDDGVNIVKPASLSGAGRYIRQAQSGFSGTVPLTFSGLSSPVNVTASYYVVGNIVEMLVPPASGTSNSTAFTATFTNPTTLSGIAPISVSQWVSIPAMTDASSGIYSQVATVSTAAALTGVVTLTFYKNGSASGWTNTGTKALSDGTSNSTVFRWMLQ